MPIVVLITHKIDSQNNAAEPIRKLQPKVNAKKANPATIANSVRSPAALRVLVGVVGDAYGLGSRAMYL